jgi:hypothetical protein
MKKLVWIQWKERERGLTSTKLWIHFLKQGWSFCLLIEILQCTLNSNNIKLLNVGL